MKSLFLKIFVSFWLSTALIFVVSIVMSERMREDIGRDRFNRTSNAVLFDSQALFWAYDEHGCPGLRSNEKALSRLYELQILLLEQNGDVLCGPGPPLFRPGNIPPLGTIHFRLDDAGAAHNKR